MICAPERAMRVGRPGCLVVGPGLGMNGSARGWLEAALASEHALILDADALNLIAAQSTLGEALKRRIAPTLLTPHPGEAGRLLGCETASIQADRPTALAALIGRYRSGIILKGANTLVRFPSGPLWRNATGNPGMAAPGMGDVLSGMIAALCAQGLSLERAAIAAVHLHGAAGDAVVAASAGLHGLTASEVARGARDLLNQAMSKA
jgi:hydroxyethylthiazole kinase-like uncharacterized protein yjeF